MALVSDDGPVWPGEQEQQLRFPACRCDAALVEWDLHYSWVIHAVSQPHPKATPARPPTPRAHHSARIRGPAPAGCRWHAVCPPEAKGTETWPPPSSLWSRPSSKDRQGQAEFPVVACSCQATRAPVRPELYYYFMCAFVLRALQCYPLKQSTDTLCELVIQTITSINLKKHPY